jgi:transposase
MSQGQEEEGTMKKIHRVRGRFNGLSVGLDIHKKFIEYCVLSRSGDQLASGRIASDRAALEKLVQALRKRGPLQVALEACGCFVWVFDTLVESIGRDCVRVAQPSRLHVIANSMEKNDSNDAWWLAYLLYEQRLPEAFVAEGFLRELRIATRELRAWTNQRGDLIRRFRSHLAQAGESLKRKNWHASKLGRAEAKELIGKMKGERVLALRELLRQIQRLGREVLYWRSRVDALAAHLPAVKIISQEMPGFGPIIASTVVAELGSPQRFHNQKAYAKSTGLTPGYRESGGKGAQVGITRQGSSHARWAFTRAVIGCMRSKRDPWGVQIRKWIELRAQYKPKRKLIVAAARKLAEGVWRLFALGEVFDLARAFPVRAT